MSEEFGNNYVVLTDEDGNEVEFEHIDTVEVDGQTYLAFIPAELSVEDEAEVKFSQEEARRLCGRLKDPYRAVAVAYYCEDLTLAEISKLTGDNPKTVATRLYRAKKLLKIILSEEESA